MGEKAWKVFERSVCRDLGSDRRGPIGRDMSDCADDCPYSVEVKRTAEGRIASRDIDQARRHGKLEGKPWILVVGQAGSPADALAVCEWRVLRDLARRSRALEAVDRGVLEGSDADRAATRRLEAAQALVQRMVNDKTAIERRLDLALKLIDRLESENNRLTHESAILRGENPRTALNKGKARDESF